MYSALWRTPRRFLIRAAPMTTLDHFYGRYEMERHLDRTQILASQMVCLAPLPGRARAMRV